VELHDAEGIPPELYRGNLSLQTAPMAARLFESHWQHLVDAGNAFLRWVVRKVSDELGWKPLGVRLEKPRIADNMDQLMLLLQLMPTGKISDTTLLQQLGRNFAEELRRIEDDNIQKAKSDIKTQQETGKLVSGSSMLQQAVEEQRAMSQPPPQGGAPMPGGAPAGPQAGDPVAEVMARIESFGNPETPASILDQYHIAHEAAAILAPLPLGTKRQKLREIDQINKPIGDLVRSQIESVTKEQDRQFVEQGRAMMQQQGGIPPM